MLPDPLLFSAVVECSRIVVFRRRFSFLAALPIAVAAPLAFLQHERSGHFDAPKAQLFELIVRGLLRDLFRDSPGLAWMVVALLAAFVFGVPAFLAWDFAKGKRRRTWAWVALALLTSWLVLPLMWIASSRAGDADSGSEGAGP